MYCVNSSHKGSILTKFNHAIEKESLNTDMAKLKMILWILKVRPKVMKQSQKKTQKKR